MKIFYDIAWFIWAIYAYVMVVYYGQKFIKIIVKEIKIRRFVHKYLNPSRDTNPERTRIYKFDEFVEFWESRYNIDKEYPLLYRDGMVYGYRSKDDYHKPCEQFNALILLENGEEMHKYHHWLYENRDNFKVTENIGNPY